MAPPLLTTAMIIEQRQLQAEMKTTRQLLVRYVHAPCVKLTLQTRPGAGAAPAAGRVLKLQHNAAAAGLPR